MDTSLMHTFLCMLQCFYGVLQLNWFRFQLLCHRFMLQKRKFRRRIMSTNTSKILKKKRKERLPRRFWKRPGRCAGWWDNMQSGLALPEEWRESIRMSEQTFNKLCELLRPFVEKETTRFRVPVSVETQIAATLYYLSDGGRMRKTANSFGLATPTISCIVRRVTSDFQRTLQFVHQGTRN